MPSIPKRIGVVTSLKAAALRDILNVLSRRFPLTDVLVSPTLVQGDEAPPRIVASIEALNRRDDVDVIIVARGGGSIEELWAFNDERVARAVAASRIPIICGVGHETDFSLADFAADRRAPTPSAAAELVVPDQVELRAELENRAIALTRTLKGIIDEQRWRLNEHTRSLKHLSPITQLRQARQRIDDLVQRAEKAVGQGLNIRQEKLEGLQGRLTGVGPMGTLKRGYAIVQRSEDQAVICSVEQVTPGERLRIRVVDGDFEAETK